MLDDMRENDLGMTAFVAVVALVLAALVLLLAWGTTSVENGHMTPAERFAHYMDECLALERYSEDSCAEYAAARTVAE